MRQGQPAPICVGWGIRAAGDPSFRWMKGWLSPRKCRSSSVRRRHDRCPFSTIVKLASTIHGKWLPTYPSHESALAIPARTVVKLGDSKRGNVTGLYLALALHLQEE